MNRIILAFLFAFFITGCASVKEPQKIITTETIVISPPSELTRNCEVPVPFTKEEYLNASKDKKEEMLTQLIVDQYSSIGDCNVRIKGLRSWIEKQQKLYNK